MANLPAMYHHLFFSSFIVFAPKDRALSKYISENDLNCAVSSPNALLGSRVNLEGSPPASFGITNPDSMAKDGLLPFFTLLSFYIKPLDAPPPGTTVFVKGYSYRHTMPLQWHVDVVNGYHLPLLVNMQEFSGLSWDELYRVEMWADYGEDALDWEFCVDDLEIQFYQKPKDEKRELKHR